MARKKRENLESIALRSRWWIRHDLSFAHLHGFLLWAGLIGFGGALVTVWFREAMQWVAFLLTGKIGRFSEISASLPAWQRMLIPTLGGLLAGLILQYGMNWARGRRTTDYMEAVTLGDGFISVRASLVKSASSLLTIGSGGSIGREGAMVQLAAMLGSALGRILKFPAPTRRQLVACGAAAGIASAYNAPLAAAIFVAEIVLDSFQLESIAPIIVSSVIANATVHGLMGYEPVYQIPHLEVGESWELIFFLILGLLAGHLAPTFLWMLDKSQNLYQRRPLPIFLRLGLGGLAVGIISVHCPQVWGNGYSVVNSILHNPWTTVALLDVLVSKILATSAMVGSGAVGGVFTPTLFCGAALGALVGSCVQQLFPWMADTTTVFAVVGMGAFLAASTHAPLTSILMVFEMTRQYEVVLPLMLASVAAHYVAKMYRHGKSIYAESLTGKRLGREQVRLLPWQELAHPVQSAVTPEADLETMRARLAEVSFNNLQVVDGQGIWRGVVGRKAVASAPPESTATSLMDAFSRCLRSNMSLEEALQVASEIPSENLPLVQYPEQKLIGMISKSDLLRALQNRLRALARGV
ncbi:MAG: ClcB-like voltage-gated chloride channel protein [Candidatus Eremiobacteraeota bacterium]|nr:ClcB-like voltage-gated chloride channel protein [Candidatus Eremiobacteraeota bacterium]MCW5870336.1 ClcB-like voltage-gated chloride channel protein [Candidatus Eremiobacteraeota bacterium]